MRVQWGWHPTFGTQYSEGALDGTQYAKGWYAVRRNSVISYADINFYLKRSHFHQETQHTCHTNSFNSIILRARFARAFWCYFSINKLKHWTFIFISPYTWYEDVCLNIYFRNKYTVYTMDIKQRENAHFTYMFKVVCL